MINADELEKVKFHPLPYMKIVPTDVNAESYQRGWNDAIDAIMSEADTIEERKKGKWIRDEFGSVCSSCGLYAYRDKFDRPWESDYCPNCGCLMKGDSDVDE